MGPSAPAGSQELTALYPPRESPHSSDEMRTVKAFWKQEIQQTILNVSEGPRREVGGQSKKGGLLDGAFPLFTT